MARTRNSNKTIPKVRIITGDARRDIHSIRPYENNPRFNQDTIDQVAESFRNFGFAGPIVVDRKGVIINGHTRYEAAKQLGMSEVPCITADHLTDAQVKAFRIADNKTAETSNWDFGKLSEELGSIEAMGFDLSQMVKMGFNQEEMDCLSGMVEDDCLSSGVAAALEESTRSGSAADNARGPDRTRMVIGEFVIYIPTVKYKQWSSEIRVEGDYVAPDIEKILLERLGVTPYLEAK